MLRFLLLLPVIMLMVACSIIGIRSGIEQSHYEVVELLPNNLEIRRYDPRLALETTIQGGDWKNARSQAFRRLFNYISGDNQRVSKISMTAPAKIAMGASGSGIEIAMTAPVEILPYKDRLKMRFFLPSELDVNTVPVPRDPKVRVISVPRQTLAVLGFTGLANKSDLVIQQDRLTEALASTHWDVQGSMTAYFYDPPWTIPFMRRNEVAVHVSDRKQ